MLPAVRVRGALIVAALLSALVVASAEVSAAAAEDAGSSHPSVGELLRLAGAGAEGCDPPHDTRSCPGHVSVLAQLASLLGRVLGLDVLGSDDLTGRGDAATDPLEVTLLCRDAWGAQPPRAGRSPHAIEQVTIHHSAVPLRSNANAPERFRDHQRLHLSNGWPDIAYHVGVDRHGHAYELRDPAYAGDSATDYGPSGHFLVLAEGDFDEEQVSAQQLERVAQVTAAAVAEYGLSGDLDEVITGHDDHANTACPGADLARHMDDIRQRVSEILGSSGARFTLLCGYPAAQRIAGIEAGRS